jgi:hypothetical protein
MSIFSLGFLGLFGAAAGIASMVAAIEKGDADEASRQGVLAGPAVVERVLIGKGSPAIPTPDPASGRTGSRAAAVPTAPPKTADSPATRRAAVLAAIAAATAVEDRAELLPALATVAGSGDRRTAIPAADAARAIARELAQSARNDAFPDDLDHEDLATWRALFDQLARNANRFIEVRVFAYDTVAALSDVIAPRDMGFDLAAALGDPDPAIRAIGVALVPRPTPQGARAPLANAVKNDADDKLALAAAQVLCGDDPAPALSLLGAQGLDRIKKLVGGKAPRMTRDARRCLVR